MAKINEEMIRKVFDEMLKHKASLTKLVVDEEEDEDISDYRMLADLIIKNYPWLRLFLDIRYFAGLNSSQIQPIETKISL